MYSAPSSPFARGSSAAHAYRSVGVASAVGTASPHQLVAMLFDGLVDAITRARGAMQQGQIELKGRAIAQAVGIIDEGLKAGLNHDAGGDLAGNLSDLYGYLVMRLTNANLRNDAEALDECQRLIEPLRAAWKTIGPQVEGTRQ